MIEEIKKMSKEIKRMKREGRESLMEELDVVNEKLKRMLKNMLGGGKEEMKMIERDDKMEEGIEIIERKKGKKKKKMKMI